MKFNAKPATNILFVEKKNHFSFIILLLLKFVKTPLYGLVLKDAKSLKWYKQNRISKRLLFRLAHRLTD